MKRLCLGLSIGLLTILPALAYPPQIMYTWPPEVGSRWIKVHTNMPAACDNQTLYALNEWNKAGAQFAFGWDANNYLTATRQAQQTPIEDLQTITVEDQILDGGKGMRTSWEFDGNGYLEDADISVNSDLMFYGDGLTGEFSCPVRNYVPPPADKFDYRSAAQHEFGHGIGFQHIGDANYAHCSMYTPQQRGGYVWSLCSEEYNEFRYVYGLR